jgi:hypothetical protein
MRVTREIVTILADPVAGEVNVVFPGFRVTLTAEETAQLASGLTGGLEQLRAADKPEATSASESATPPSAGRDDSVRPFVSPTAAETELVQQRVRALIQASIRDKGLSLREEQRA